MTFILGKVYLQEDHMGRYWVLWRAERQNSAITMGTLLATDSPTLRVGGVWYGVLYEKHRELTEEEALVYQMHGGGQ